MDVEWYILIYINQLIIVAAEINLKQSSLSLIIWRVIGIIICLYVAVSSEIPWQSTSNDSAVYFAGTGATLILIVRSFARRSVAIPSQPLSLQSWSDSSLWASAGRHDGRALCWAEHASSLLAAAAAAASPLTTTSSHPMRCAHRWHRRLSLWKLYSNII